MQEFTIKPSDDYVIIRNLQKENKKLSDLLVIELKEDSTIKAEVLTVGDGKKLNNKKRLPLSVKPGEIVLVSKDAGLKTKIHGMDCTIIREDEIIAVVEE